jgi:hypothetical protein
MLVRFPNVNVRTCAGTLFMTACQVPGRAEHRGSYRDVCMVPTAPRLSRDLVRFQPVSDLTVLMQDYPLTALSHSQDLCDLVVSMQD